MIQKMIEKYLDTEAYGSNLIIKEYCRFPKFLPLPAHIEHGWTPLPNALITDLEIAETKGLMLVYSKRREQAWKKASHIPVIITGPPFVLYRRMKAWNQKKDANGTIVFPSHSTIFIESQYDIDKYCEELKKLPDKFKPITICLLYPDIARGRDKQYQKHGFEVVSAGEKLRGSLDFVRNYYEILSKFKYATSNEIGTYTFYAVEMGIPFFLTGEEPIIHNIGNKDRNISPSGKMSDHKIGKEVNIIFGSKPTEIITQEQKKLVEAEFGLDSDIRPDKLRAELFRNTRNLKYWFKLVPLFYAMTLLKYIIPRKLAYKIFKKLNK